MTDADLNSAAKALAEELLDLWRMADRLIQQVDKPYHEIILRHFTAFSEAMEKRVKELESKLEGRRDTLDEQVKENKKLRTERDQLTAKADRDYVELSGEVRRLEHVRNHLIEQVEALRVVERERDQLAGRLHRLHEGIMERDITITNLEREKKQLVTEAGLQDFIRHHLKERESLTAELTSLRAQLAKGGGE